MKKTAIVTGAARGIGLAVAGQLGLDGCRIVMTARGREENYREAIESLRSRGIEAAYIQADVSVSKDREKVVQEAVRIFGRIDILVNNAGVAPLERADLLDMMEESFDRVIGINTKGTMFLTQLVAKQMLLQERTGGVRGYIVNISSCSSETVSINRGEYCVSKAGISMLTGLFAVRLAGEGILVNEVRPGVIATDMTNGVKEKYDNLIEDGIFPIARWGRPEDVAAAVSALVSGKFDYSTGIHIDVDGGFHIKRL
ncbi:MAG: 3-ketoacyl-ACP reductase [Lachnospiraceae bacterium]|nr:3-ketoacyl-ACP reductase [Lachnospiraceae bacterium]